MGSSARMVRSMPIQKRLSVWAASIVVPHPSERVHHEIAFVAGGLDHAFVEGNRFLCGVVEAFFGL